MNDTQMLYGISMFGALLMGASLGIITGGYLMLKSDISFNKLHWPCLVLLVAGYLLSYCAMKQLGI